MTKFIKIHEVDYAVGIDSSSFPTMFFTDLEDTATDDDIHRACVEKVFLDTGVSDFGYGRTQIKATNETLTEAFDALILEITSFDVSYTFKDELESSRDQLEAFIAGHLKMTTIVTVLQNLVEILEQFKPERVETLNLGHVTLQLFDEVARRGGNQPLTYKQLKKVLDNMSKADLEANVTILSGGEFFGATSFFMDPSDDYSDVIEPGNLVINTIEMVEE